jgi:two-component system sensor kinase FixL
MEEPAAPPADSLAARIDSVRRRVERLESLARRSAAQKDSLELLRELRATLEELAASEAALRDSVARTQAIVDTAVDGIITIDERGIVHSFNPAAERIFGYRAAEVIGRNISMLMPSPDRERHDGYLARYLQTGEKRIIGIGREVVGRRSDGSTFPMDLAVGESQVKSGRVFTGMVRDITARKQSEGQLLDLQKLAQQRERLADIGAITAKLAHDLGNPLAGISMQAQLILRRANRNPAQPLETVTKAAEQIVAQVARLDRLAKDLVGFAREQRLDLRRVNPARFFRDLMDFWIPMAAERRIVITLEMSEPTGVVRADEEKLRRVFDNLMKNAVEAIDGDWREIAIRVAPREDELCISVVDSGCGIPQSVEIFRLFETTKPEGTGLGLAIAKQIVDAHGGQIHCERLQPRGTLFTVELPVRGPASYDSGGPGR